MAVIKGYLKDGAGVAVEDCTIVLHALKTTSAVITKVSSFTTTKDGYYEINAQTGNYDVILLVSGQPPKAVGKIQIFSDSKSGTLNDYLLNPSESEITPAVLAQIVDERKKAQQAADNATSTLANVVKKTGDTMPGNLTFEGNGRGVYFSPSNHRMMSGNGIDLNFDLVGSDGRRNGRLDWLKDSDTWGFKNCTVTINSMPVLRAGDGGINTKALPLLSDFKSLDTPSGIYRAFGASAPNIATQNAPPSSGNTTLTVTARNNGLVSHYEVIENASGSPIKWLGECYKSGGSLVIFWTKVITTAISTVDSNGFYKKASPVLRLFANEDIEDMDGFTQSGCGLVNSEARSVTAKRIDVGHYEIHGSLGFAKEGWYITLPEDANGNKKFFAEYSTDENNVITVKTFTKKWSAKRCEVVAGEPVDITEDRWIDLRLDMPVIEKVIEDAVEVFEPVEIIPSLLNPIII